MNKNLKKILISKASKRIVSGLTAFVLLFGALPMNNIYDELSDMQFPVVSKVEAAVTHTEADDTLYPYTHRSEDPSSPDYLKVIVSPNQFKTYSERAAQYHKYHQFDRVFISGAQGSDVFIEGFTSIGTEQYPFGGSINIQNANTITLNLDAPLFDYVYDNVELNNNNKPFEISREYGPDDMDLIDRNQTTIDTTPLLANNVRHNKNSSPATWNVKIVTPTAGETRFLADFGGLIGKMCKVTGEGSASLTLSVTMNKETGEGGDVGSVNVMSKENKQTGSKSDIGFICGAMEEGTSLTASLSATRDIAQVTSDCGDAGGLVGRMESGSSFTYSGANNQVSGSKIETTAAEKYAGGIVGRNNGGKVTVTPPSGAKYGIDQIINGSNGAGGLFGYYQPSPNETADFTFDATVFDINCKLNSENFSGGLFGVLDNPEKNMTISGKPSQGSNAVIVSEAETSSTGYGGLIGKYDSTDLSKSLIVKSITAQPKNTGSAYYGGAVAIIASGVTQNQSTNVYTMSGGVSYVKFDDFTLSNAQGANTNNKIFGGLAANADRAFIDSKDVTIGVSGGSFQGGGLVGSLESGVLRLMDKTDISGTNPNVKNEYRVGQIVGYRDNALIFAENSWKLVRRTDGTTCDDIGSWGQVVRLDGKGETRDGDALTQTIEKIGSDTIFTVDETGHFVTLEAPEYGQDEDSGSSFISVGSKADFAKAALNMQLNDANLSSSGVLRFNETQNRSSDLLSMDIKLSDDISDSLDLSGTGISSFTRDNAETDEVTAPKCVYSGHFDGNGKTIKLSIGEPFGYRGGTAVSNKITSNNVDGSGKIYRHRYNGLFGITNFSGSDDEYVIQNVTFDGNITVNAKRNLYVGAAAGCATESFNVCNVNMTDVVDNNTHSSQFKAEGSNIVYMGGLLGKAANSIRNINVYNCDIKCNITSNNNNASSCYGGVIGLIAHATPATSLAWSFENIKLSGTVEKTEASETNKVGGLVAAISEASTIVKSQRSMFLTNITIDGLTVSAKGSGDATTGGLLGYSWLNVNPTFHYVYVKNTSTVKLTDTASKNGNLAGLVYNGTGYWIVEAYDLDLPDPENEDSTISETKQGIYIDDINVSASYTKSFGMIVNKGKTDYSAIYLEVLGDNNDVKSYQIDSRQTEGDDPTDATLDLESGCVYDELVAYSATAGKVLENGQGVVSIHSEFTTDGSSASNSYRAQTHRGAAPNPNTRYYYNLDVIKDNSDPADNLMKWALDIYAHKSIREYFNNDWTISRGDGDKITSTTLENGNYKLENYSWYPVDITGTVKFSEGNYSFTFFNAEFEGSEAANGGDHAYLRTSLHDSTNDKDTQHHLMHCGLFRNAYEAKINITKKVTLKGNVGWFGKVVESNGTISEDKRESGAFICGTIYGSSTAATAGFSVSGTAGAISLDGICVNGISADNGTNSKTYAPLLINKIGSFSNISFQSGSTTNSSASVYTNNGGYEDDYKAATSLIGNVGSSGASNIDLYFSKMKLDGRKNTNNNNQYSLDSIYKTKSSIFTKATLLNYFMFADASSAIYNYNLSEDWAQSGTEGSYTYSRTSTQTGVTYGSEISDSTGHNQYYGEEFWYKDQHESGIYTNYNQPTASGTGPTTVDFSAFLPYVNEASTKAQIENDTYTNKKYQIKVNHTDLKMSGCGTYNDPYLLTSPADFDKIADYLSGTVSAITLPKIADNSSVDATKLKQIKWDAYGHEEFGTDFKNAAGNSYDKAVIQNYLAGAYYKVMGNYTLNTSFKGFGNTSEEQAIFRGIIIGDNHTITLTGPNPLIYASNGSVVKDLNIQVNNSSNITIDVGNNSARFSNSHKPNNSAKAYGAVMGRILGGDNIIDAVTVNFGNTKIVVKGNQAQLIAVGGYVGAIEKGTLVFKGMEKGEAGSGTYLRGTDAIKGLKADTVKFGSETDLINKTVDGETVPNLKWLYINPIVGRVVNAAVFTEATAYRPFEDGTREGVTGLTDTTYEKYSQAVTMKNGTKNYSIADITPSLEMFTTDVPERTSDWKGAEEFRRFLKVNIGIPNAQALYVMSLVTQAGLGATNYLERAKRGSSEQSNNNYYPAKYSKPVGGYLNTGSWGIAPYFRFRATHTADYTYVGNCGAVPSAGPAEIAEGDSDEVKAEKRARKADFEKASKDNAQYNRKGIEPSVKESYARELGVDSISYIIANFTPKIPIVTDDRTPNPYDTSYYSNIKNKELGYIAFCITHQYTYMNLSFTANKDSYTYYMPDGYRGLGTFGYQNTNNNDSQFSEVYQDLIVHLYGIEGNGNTVNLNMQHYCYFNKDPYAIANDAPGYGFMDAMMQNKTYAVGENATYVNNIDPTDPKFQIRNFKLTGRISSDVIDPSTEGQEYVYDSNVNNGKYWAVGGLAGNVVYSNSDDKFVVSIQNIGLDDLTIDGVRYTGGLLGYNRSADHAFSKTTITNISTLGLDVTSGLYTGGLIGYSTQTALDISDITIQEPDLKTSFVDSDNNATGGIIGYVDTNTNNGQVYLHDITIGKKSDLGDDYTAYIGYKIPDGGYPSYEKMKVGGLIGQTATNSSGNIGTLLYNTKIEKCDIYNVDISGHKTGGLVGASENANVYLGVFDTIVMSNDSKTIKGQTGTSTSLGAGGVIGYTVNINNRFTVGNCSIQGYNIESNQNAGGIAGCLNGGNTFKAKINDTMISDIKLVASQNSGALAGTLSKNLDGYNILTDLIRYKNASGNYGHLVGVNSSVIKIAGMSCQRLRNTAAGNNYSLCQKMIGNKGISESGRYGSGGYVVFADYEGKSKAIGERSITASEINDDDNVAANDYAIETKTAVVNNYPYVTVSPKIQIDPSGAILTGDAATKLAYNASIFKSVVDDSAADKFGAYRNFGTITASDKEQIESKYSTANKEFQAGSMAGNSNNFPLLIVDDNDYTAVTSMINKYINVLANTTNENYAEDNSMHKVSLFKCTYTNNAFVLDDKACLRKLTTPSGKFFRMLASDVDNANASVAQFTLMDVQFYDPSTVGTGNEKVAYHLYIPIYVRKLLQYRFKASLLSNTEYYPDAYLEEMEGNTVFENLGNPVTMKFEYVYERKASEWIKAINAGEDVYHNLNKTLAVKKHDNVEWPVGTRMVLVDANDNDKHYYLDTAPSGAVLDLRSFTNNGTNFKPAALEKMMTITMHQPDDVTQRTLVETTSDDPKVTLEVGGKYFRPLDETDSDDPDDTEHYVPSSNRWAVNTLTVNDNERYYITIFTPKNESDTDIYHYSISSSDKLVKTGISDVDAGWRPNQISKDQNTTVDLFTGNLYVTTLSMNVDSKNEGSLIMSGNNNWLTVEMESTVRLNGSENAIKTVAQNMESNKDYTFIYQTFLSTYDTKETADGTSMVGINMNALPKVVIATEPDPNDDSKQIPCYKKYLYPKDDDDDPTNNVAHTVSVVNYNDPVVTENYVEMRNSENLVGDICKDSNGYAATMRIKYHLKYLDENDLPVQFPYNENQDSGIGTQVIGYSNISSSSDSAAYSAVSTKDNSQIQRYYVLSQKGAKLEYSLVRTSGQIAGPFSEAGINAAEPDVDAHGRESDKTKSRIHTQAKYDTSMLKDTGKYIEMTLSLSNKSDYTEKLKISDYLDNLKIKGTLDSVLFDMANDDDGDTKRENNEIIVKVNRTDNEYKIWVRKDKVKTIGNASEGIFSVPIEFEAFTGDKGEKKFKNGENMYANYKVTLEMRMFDEIPTPTVDNPNPSPDYKKSTYDTDFIVYSNARVLPKVID